jgi:hypothetical protein
MNDYVDVIVPRGGKSLIERISKEATIDRQTCLLQTLSHTLSNGFIRMNRL